MHISLVPRRKTGNIFLPNRCPVCPFVSSFQPLPDMPVYTRVLVTSHKEVGTPPSPAVLPCVVDLSAAGWSAQLLQDACPGVSCGSHIPHHSPSCPCLLGASMTLSVPQRRPPLPGSGCPVSTLPPHPSPRPRFVTLAR